MEDFLEEEKQSTEGSFNVKNYLSKLARNWYWIILCLVLSFFVAKFILQYTIPKYLVSGHILIGAGEIEGNSNSILANAGLLAENSLGSISNDIFILKSHKIIGKVVDSLKSDLSFKKTGQINDKPIDEAYLPVNVMVKKFNQDRVSPIYKLTLTTSNFSIGTEKSFLGRSYGIPFVLNKDTITISKRFGVNFPKQAVFTFQIQNRLSTVKKYISNLTVAPARNAGAGLLKISVTHELPSRAKKIIDVLIYEYNESFLEYKNLAIHRALVFLGQRLKSVSVELEEQENEVRDFKLKHRLYDASSAAMELIGKLKGVDAQRSQHTYEEDLLALVEKSIRNHSNKEEIVATASGFSDPILSDQISQYNSLVGQKQNILIRGTEMDTRISPLNEQLKKLRENILKNIASIRKQSKVTTDYFSSQEQKFAGQFEVLPEKEKEYVDLNRKLGIKQSLYIFLLQKREDTEIQLISSDNVRSRTVDDILNEGVVSPIKQNIYGMSIGIGLLLPCLIILMRVILNQKIETKQEIEQGTNVPILGELSFSNTLDPITITSLDRTAIAEQFRAIRTNLSYLGASNKKQVFLVTSSMSGEGKSFVSLNLANSMAISNKKVVVLELDLRKPMLSKKLDIVNKVGISNYLVKGDLEPKDIIQPLKNYPNLFLINSGPIPPNPGELIINPRLEILINYLRENFDYVILDSPPVGLVADSLSLGKLSDISLFVIRHNYSLKSSLKLLNELYLTKKLPNLSLIINGILADKGYGYGGSGGYGYGYGYYSDDGQTSNRSFKNIIKKVFKRN